MSQPTVIPLFSQVAYEGDNPNHIGTKQPAASYYVSGNNLQTITWNLTNVTGLITIQASLADDPSSNDTDWFTIMTLPCSSLTQNSFANLYGNYVWVRAKMVGMTSGLIHSIKISY
jgi:hypothetical protein